jgi:hypothetical protein
MGPSASSKSVSRVTATERPGSSLRVTGRNRVSCRADVRAKSERPAARGCGSKVPMQPRRFRSSEPGVMVFHVTKRGDEVAAGVFMESVEEDGVVFVVDILSDDEEEEVVGSEEDELAVVLDRRSSAGFVGRSTLAAKMSSSSPEPGSSASSSTGRLLVLGYDAHEDSTWDRAMGVRPSRLALSASKQ